MEAIRLIDYEYAGLNAVAYDIANHWCEYAANYGTDTPEVLDYGKLPSPEQRVRSKSLNALKSKSWYHQHIKYEP